MSESNELTVREEPSIGSMMQAVIANGVTNDNAVVLEKMMDLYERMDKRNAEKQFAQAFAALQAETSQVQATVGVPGKDGTIKYHFAPFEDLNKMIKPLLVRHGFSISFDSIKEGAITTSICTLLHNAGHSKSNRFAATLSSPPHASAAQADGATKTYAKRMALIDALNIVVCGMDDDARDIGEFIGEERGKAIEARVIAANRSTEKFLKWVKADSFATIGESYMPQIEEELTRCERK